jgi:hypothetical protein
MMRILLFSAGAVFTVSACKDPVTPPPTPEPTNVKACFTPSKTFIDSGESVTFTQCSENDKSWQWVFAPGAVLTNDRDAPPQTYNVKPGLYPVTLTVFSSDGKYDDDTTIDIAVARRSFSKIVIKKYPMLNSSGGQWDLDDNSSADVKLYFGPSKSPLMYESSVFTNATGEITYVLPTPIKIGDDNNSSWVFKLVDDDGGNNQPMATFGNNGDIFLSRGGASPITIINTTNYQIEAYYDRVQP